MLCHRSLGFLKKDWDLPFTSTFLNNRNYPFYILLYKKKEFNVETTSLKLNKVRTRYIESLYIIAL